MKHVTISKRYFLWIYNKIFGETHIESSYYKLLSFLHDNPFRYTVPMDANREEDGFELRYRFADEEGVDKRIAASEIDNKACSVLEMMAALAIRCEEQIMSEPNKPDQTGKWFMVMLYNLGLDIMDDQSFDQQEAEQIVERFLDRRYSRDGDGGLFRIKNSPVDMRKVEIWYQLNWYISKVIETED